MQLLPPLSQSCHWYVKVGAGVPDQLPGLACNCWPTATVPVTDGCCVLTGACGTTDVGAEMAWLLARSEVTLPIPGTASIQHLEENLGAGRLRLDPDEVAALEEAVG